MGCFGVRPRTRNSQPRWLFPSAKSHEQRRGFFRSAEAPRPSPLHKCGGSHQWGTHRTLSLENVFEDVKRGLFGLAIQNKTDCARGISGQGNLAEAYHPVSKVREDWNEHGELVVHFPLGDFGAQFELTAVGRLHFILEFIARDLSIVDPLLKKPIEAAV